MLQQITHIAVELAVKYIQVNLMHKITLKQLTACTGYSERSLQLLFQKHFNMSPFEYIEEQRFLLAYKKIKEYGVTKNTAAIAYDVGFKHLGRFSIKFKKRFGVSPSVFARTANIKNLYEQHI
jgi:AraC-like DNA-binding protein